MPKSKVNKPSRSVRKVQQRKKRGTLPEPAPERTALSTTRAEHSALGILDRAHVDALSRVTSSLTTHVLRAAQGRDPAEQVLEEARAHYRESERQIQFRCDECGLLSPGASSEERAISSARALGWLISEESPECPAQCPSCQPGAPKLLPGQITASIPEALLSSPERIFCDRVDWLTKAYEQRTSPRALLINSRSSGHRRMLTSFAESVGYDVEKLDQNASSLRGKGIHLPTFEDREQAREWFRGLFELLRLEDGA